MNRGQEGLRTLIEGPRVVRAENGFENISGGQSHPNAALNNNGRHVAGQHLAGQHVITQHANSNQNFIGNQCLHENQGPYANQG